MHALHHGDKYTTTPWLVTGVGRDGPFMPVAQADACAWWSCFFQQTLERQSRRLETRSSFFEKRTAANALPGGRHVPWNNKHFPVLGQDRRGFRKRACEGQH